MKTIKTREPTTHTVKTIDRASIVTEHIRQASFKVRDTSVPDRSDNEQVNYAQDRMTGMAHTELSMLPLHPEDSARMRQGRST